MIQGKQPACFVFKACECEQQKDQYLLPNPDAPAKLTALKTPTNAKSKPFTQINRSSKAKEF